jgi:predicted DCC family thiol-disulfide oxidoreductase YuxK
VLFSRTSRRILPAVGILMHIGIVFLQNIVFLDLTLLLFIFYDFREIRQRIGQWAGRAGPITLLYDGMCPFCGRTVRILRSMDLFRRIKFEDFRSVDLAVFNHRHAAGVTRAALENEMFVCARGKGYSGFEAYRVLALALPPLWPVAPLLFVPGAATLGTVVYGYIARNRRALVKCDVACSMENAPSENPVLSDAKHSRRLAWACGITIAAIIAFQGFFWLNRIEFYPFTSVQMFTGKPGTVVTYYKTLGHWESGRVSPLYLEDTLGVMSINSRYEGLFDLCFGDATQSELCRKTVSILGSAYNGKAHSDDKLTQLEIQRWKWDFGAKPRDPGYGELDARFVGAVRRDARAQVPGSDRH